MTGKIAKSRAALMVVAAAVAGVNITGGPAQAAEPEVSHCVAAQLTGQIGPVQPAAGNRWATLQVTNQGDAACTLYGHSGLQLATADGTILPTNANPYLIGTVGEPSVVTLQPLASATAGLHWIVGPCGTAGDDGTPATRPAAITVIPPEETTGFTLPWEYGAVCGEIDGPAKIDITFYTAL